MKTDRLLNDQQTSNSNLQVSKPTAKIKRIHFLFFKIKRNCLMRHKIVVVVAVSKGFEGFVTIDIFF